MTTLSATGNTAVSRATAGIETYEATVTGGTLHVVTLRNPDGTVGAVSSNFAATGSGGALPVAKLTALNATTGSLPAGAITGAGRVTMISTNATPGAQLVRTAAQMLAEFPGAGVGFAWTFRICNSGAGTLTLTADAGPTVTLSGTMTVAQNTWRDFEAVFTSATAATITNTGLGTYT